MKYADIFLRAFQRRESLFSCGHTDCYRLFNGSGDGLDGLVADLYGNFVLIQFYNTEVTEDDTLNSCIAADFIKALKIIPVSIQGVLVKNRLPVKDSRLIQQTRKSSVIEGYMPHENYTVKQNNCIAEVDLIEGQNTGIFLDMRIVRQRLASLGIYSGSILNLFCYTAIFSVHGILSGAESAQNVDLAKSVLLRARKNYALNGLRCDDRNFTQGDTGDLLTLYKKKSRQFDLVIYDPPTFSRNKNKTYSVKKDYQYALQTIEALNPRFVVTSVNTISISVDEYKSYHPQNWNSVEIMHEPSDFPLTDSPYLKTGIWEIKAHY